MPNPFSPYAMGAGVPVAGDLVSQILAQVNAQLAEVGIASPFAGADSLMTPSRMPSIGSTAERAASSAGREHEPIQRTGWLAALQRLRQQSGGHGGDHRDSRTQRLMRDAARRAGHGGGRSRSNASGGTVRYGNIGPNTHLRISVSGGRAYDRG